MKKYLYLIILLVMPFAVALAQEKSTFTVSGTVYDENGAPLPGATLYIKDRVTLGTSSNSEGKFSIKAEKNEIVVVSFVGYENQEYLVTGNKDDLEFHMKEGQELEEVVVTALGSQRKISSVAAVTSVDVKDLQVPAPSITNMLGGRVAGVITMQTSGEPGKNLAEFWIRGIGTFGANASALVLIDGLEGDINSIDPADIESFSILKDASATAVYGVRGANGVVLITTKKGQEGKLSINVRANASLSQLRRMPDYLGAYEWAKLSNEAHEVRGEAAPYNDTELEVIRRHLDNDLYPDVDWQKEIIRPVSFKQSYYASARGGGQIARYFVSLGYSDEQGAYKADKNSPYASNVGYNTYSFRTNLDINLSKSTVLYFGADMWMDINRTPGVSNTDVIWAAQSRFNPLLVPMQYSNGWLPSVGTGSGINGWLPSVGTGSGINPYVMINRLGRSSSQAYRNMATLAINQDLGAIVKGLKLSVQGAYNRNGGYSENRTVMPSLWRVTDRNYNGELIGTETVQATNVSYGEGSNWFRKFHLESKLTYDRAFGDHRVGGLVYYYISDEKNSGSSSSLDGIPVRYQGVSSRLTYGFRDTYMIDFNFGFTGSENFPKGKQYGLFPSVALGWVPTSYQWVKDNLKWINHFKIRGSYGTVGNDRIGGRRFPFLTRVSQGATNPFGASSRERVWVSTEGADNLVWEKAIKSDVGVDVQLLDSRLTFTVDLFNDQRNGIFQPRVQVPSYVGLTNMPYGNVGRMRSWGSDGNIAYSHSFGKNISFTVRGNYTYSQNEIQAYEKVYEPYRYQDMTGLPNQVVRGLRCLGFFKDETDVKYSPVQNWGSVLPGDLKYEDVNGDGFVNDDDRVPIAFDNFPLIMYGVGAEFRYKKLSVGILFKGRTKTDYFCNDPGYIPFWGYSGDAGNVLSRWADPSRRWIPRQYALDHGIDASLAENPNAELPRLSYGTNSNNTQDSDFWKRDGRYLRLQELTLNYNLTGDMLKKIGIQSIDIQLVGNNLYVWDKVKLFDPEQAGASGAAYPLPAVYSIQFYINL